MCFINVQHPFDNYSRSGGMVEMGFTNVSFNIESSILIGTGFCAFGHIDHDSKESLWSYILAAT